LSAAAARHFTISALGDQGTSSSASGAFLRPTGSGKSSYDRAVVGASYNTRRGAALIVLLTAAGASAVDGTFAAIVIGVLIGLAVVGLHAIMYRLWQRFLPIPQLPSDASKRERALAVRKYAVRALIPILPLVAVGWALAFLPPEDRPSLSRTRLLLAPATRCCRACGFCDLVGSPRITCALRGATWRADEMRAAPLRQTRH
jgi:hypothetical protein